MIYIFGVDHVYQTGFVWDQDRFLGVFEGDLSHLIQDEGIELVAEEFSKMALERNGISFTIPQRHAERARIEHLFVDPDIEERKALGIRERSETAKLLGIKMIANKDDERSINLHHAEFDRLREKEWYRRIEPHASKNLIFVCGYSHVEHFIALLQEHGFEPILYGVYTPMK